jgi:hypothetical protein
MNEGKVEVLIERMNNYLDGQKRIEGQLSMLVQMQLAQESMREQIKTLQSGQVRLFEKTDEVDTAIQPLRDEMIGNRKLGRAVACMAVVIPGVISFLALQWHPWTEYTDQKLSVAKDARDTSIGKFQFDVGQELRRNDNRLTVLEFRANNVDNKSSK